MTDDTFPAEEVEVDADSDGLVIALTPVQLVAVLGVLIAIFLLIRAKRAS